MMETSRSVAVAGHVNLEISLELQRAITGFIFLGGIACYLVEIPAQAAL